MGKKSRRKAQTAGQSQQQQQPRLTKRELMQELDRLDLGEDGEPTDRAKMNFSMVGFNSEAFTNAWSDKRYNSFFLYGMIMIRLEDRNQITYQDFTFVKSICKSTTEPAIYRAFAYRLAAFVSLFGFKGADTQGVALQHFENVIAVCDSASREEKARGIVPITMEGKLVSVPTFLQEQRNYAQESIKNMAENVILAYTPTGESMRVPILAASKCDFCLRDRGDNNSSFMVCGRCKLAHYCSRKCQERSWKEHGHKVTCRKKGDFRVGDIVACLDPVGDVQFGKQVRLKAPAPDDPNPDNPSHWVVETKGAWVAKEDDNGPKVTQVISAKRIRRVRSSLWNVSGGWEAADADMSSGNEVDGDVLPSLVVRRDVEDD